MIGLSARSMRSCWALRIAAFLVAMAFPVLTHAECGYDRLSVRGSSDEQTAACAAMRDVLAYFAQMGFNFTPDLTIAFSEQVFIELFDPNRASAPMKIQVSGYFNSARRLIEIASPASPHMGHRKPWGLPWTPEIVYSILRHELAHAALHQAMGESLVRVSKAWIEYIAYAVQIELMDESLRSRVLANYPDAAPFETPERVNQMIYGYDPDAFGVRAYLHARERGGAQFIRLLARKETAFDLGEIFWMK